MVDDVLHKIARNVASQLSNPDRKHLRFNEIVDTAKRFYPNDVGAGVRELVLACDRDSKDLYDKVPMWKSLNLNFDWMLSVD